MANEFLAKYSITHFHISSSFLFCFFDQKKDATFWSFKLLDWFKCFNKLIGPFHPRGDKPRDFCCTSFSVINPQENLNLLKENGDFHALASFISLLSFLMVMPFTIRNPKNDNSKNLNGATTEKQIIIIGDLNKPICIKGSTIQNVEGKSSFLPYSSQSCLCSV